MSLLAITILMLPTPAAGQWEEMIYANMPYSASPVLAQPVTNKINSSSATVNSNYRVQRGDTLIGICRHHQITMGQLLKSNNISNPDLVMEGQTLTIPGTAPGVAQENCQWPVPAMALPVEGRISSEFGIRQEGRPHQGVDIAANHGAAIMAPMEGYITYAAYYGSYGNTVIIDHGAGVQSLYAHCSTLLVKQGQQVSQGQTIAKVGDTGRSFGPHLHWEVQYQGIPFDPLLCQIVVAR